MDYANALHRKFPQMEIKGEVQQPPPMNALIANILSMGFLGGIVLQIFGKMMLPEPAYNFMDKYRFAFIAAIFGCNMVAGSLIQTGAFEVSYDGQPIWSKIETHRLPTMQELLHELSEIGLNA